MTSLDPSHLPEFGWKPQPRTRGEATYDQHPSPLPIRTLPDLRFEQAYLLALKPFVHIRTDEPVKEKPKSRGSIEKPAVEAVTLAGPVGFDIVTQGAGVSRYGTPERIEWGKIAWVTIRDQVISPLIQGTVWGSASIFLGPASKKVAVSLREMFVGPSNQQLPPSAPPKASRGESMGWLRSWSSSTPTSYRVASVISKNKRSIRSQSPSPDLFPTTNFIACNL
ncbi:hypothetical protein OPQ81_000853 [Rhizoctonia solani]|nr:hypothetical protein OPQ81_000853 [Rhizoctonia solani]